MDPNNAPFYPLLPPYLDQGSEGAAVNAVIHLFRGTAWDRLPIETGNLGTIALELLPDGKYGGTLARFVTEAQRVTETDADGNLGPDTRKAILNAFEVDVSVLVGTAAMPTRFVGPHGTFDFAPGGEPVLIEKAA